MFWDKGLKIKFVDHPVRKQVFVDKKYWFYTPFSKRVSHDFVQKLEKISSQCDFGQMSLENMFDDHPCRKQAFLDHTNIHFTQWPYWDYFKGVSLWFWAKIGNIIFACVEAKIALEIIKCLINHLVKKKKQVLLDYWNMDFMCSSYCIF